MKLEPTAKPKAAMIAAMARLEVPAKAEAPKIVAMVKPEAPIKPKSPEIVVVVKPVVLAKPVISRPSLPVKSAANSIELCSLMLAGKTASTTGEVPYAVQRAIEAGNFLQTKPYKWGGGHGSLMGTGYDCSVSVSHVLI